MTAHWPAVWSRRKAMIVGAFELLVERVHGRIPELVSRSSTSTTDVKPIHVVRTFQLPRRHDDALVLSTMFTFFGGTLKVDCDLMQEGGPILRDMGSRDLGADPTDEVIDATVAAIVDFADGSEESVVAALRAQGG